MDVIIAFIHFGAELHRRALPYQIHITKHLMSLGVQVIIGAHPHVLQQHCLHDNKLVAYSLGNFLFYPRRPWSAANPVIHDTGLICVTGYFGRNRSYGYTLGDKMQQHVAATRQVRSSVYWKISVKIFVSATGFYRRTKSQILLRRLRFSQKSSSNTRRDLSLRRVAQLLLQLVA